MLMFDKSFLVDKVVNALQKNEFEVFLTQGCFDVAARREYPMLLKAVINIDGLPQEHALSLRAIAHFISAFPFVISMKNNREFLNDKTVYSRFGISVVTPRLFENILSEDEIVLTESSKGRHTSEVNAFALREKRKELNYTLDELARQVGISKKALYEIENKRVNPQQETVRKLEAILGIELKVPYEMKDVKPVYLQPKNEFQDKVSKEFVRMGIDNSSVHSAPFEIVGKERFTLITSLSHNTIKIKKEATVVKKLSNMFSSHAIFVAKNSHELEVEGVPVILESELQEIENSKELSKIIEEIS